MKFDIILELRGYHPWSGRSERIVIMLYSKRIIILREYTGRICNGAVAELIQRVYRSIFIVILRSKCRWKRYFVLNRFFASPVVYKTINKTKYLKNNITWDNRPALTQSTSSLCWFVHVLCVLSTFIEPFDNCSLDRFITGSITGSLNDLPALFDAGLGAEFNGVLVARLLFDSTFKRSPLVRDARDTETAGVSVVQRLSFASDILSFFFGDASPTTADPAGGSFSFFARDFSFLAFLPFCHIIY